MAQFFLQDECVEILNQVVCEYEHMWTKTLGEMTASALAAKAGVLPEAEESVKRGYEPPIYGSSTITIFGFMAI